jgi:anti-anti-sigma factor
MAVVDGGHRLTCHVAGEIDLANSGEIFGVLAKAVTADHEEIVLDLVDASYIDSAGLALLVDINARLHTRRTHLVVVAPEGSPAHRLLSLSGIDKVMEVQSGASPVIPDAPPDTAAS